MSGFYLYGKCAFLAIEGAHLQLSTYANKLSRNQMDATVFVTS